MEMPTRAYTCHASDTTIEALRQLRAPWSGYAIAADALTVALDGDVVVRLAVEGVDLERKFEVFRLTASAPPVASLPVEPAGDFSTGRNDVVLFHSESWIEKPAERMAESLGGDPVLQFTGRPGQSPEHASAVCTVTDAIVIATGGGSGMLVRCGLRPYTLDVVTDPELIARFLVERGYRSE